MHERSIVGKILTEGILSTWRKIWTGLGFKLGLQDERPSTNRLCPCAAENLFHTSRRKYCFSRI